MKKLFSILSLAALTIGLLGSCSKIDERISNLEKRVDGIEATSIASVQQQIDGIKTSINDLKSADVKINGKIDDLKTAAETQQTLIDALKEADIALGQKDAELEGRIATLEGQVATIGGQIETLVNADKAINTRIDELKSYVDTQIGKTKDWAEETFATLTQYEKTAEDLAKLSVTVEGISTTLTGVQTSITGLDTKIDGIDTALQGKITAAKTELEGKITSLKTELEGKITTAITASETSIKAWINGMLEGYYTIAQVDAKVTALNTAIDAVREADKERTDSVAAELTALKTAVDTVKAAIRTEYRSAIATAIRDYDGEIRGALKDSIDKVNGRIEALDTRVAALEVSVRAIEGRIDRIEAMIQSVSILPAYTDGSLEAADSILTIDLIVSPVKAIATLTKDNLKVLVSEVKTKAVSVDTISVTKFKSDATNGTITARADISSVLPVADGKTLTIALYVTNGISSYITEFYPVSLSSNVTVTEETDTTKISIKTDADFPEPVAGNILVADGFKDSKPTSIDVSGIGTVIFDSDATSKIKANAEQAGASSVFFKVENVTATTSVENADLVLEVTMKTVDEKGTEVYCEEKAAGEVTIQIPVDKDVAYVNSVTLVNDAGEPVEGGVVPGSEIIKDGILTFKVKHFSKYAVDYVTQAEYKAVTGVSIDPASVTLEVGDTLRLAATITPTDATNPRVTWSSSNTAVATVGNDGKVTAVAAGTATITVTTKDGGKTNTCSVTVTAPAPSISTIADVLATVYGGFPEGTGNKIPSGDAWVCGSDRYTYVLSSVLMFYNSDWINPTLGGIGNATGVPLTTNVTQGENCYTATYNKITLEFNMTAGKLTSIKFSNTDEDKQSIYGGTYTAPGVFSVSATKKVCFSKGNLWYGKVGSATTDTWNFETNQYDVQSSWDASHVSHFFWSKSASVAYVASYSDGSAAATDVFFTNADAETAKADFTVSGMKGFWRTLSAEEWKYLINTSARMVNHKPCYSTATSGVTIGSTTYKGIFLYPDNYNGATVSSSMTWEQIEAAGIVFLPAAGGREGSVVSGVDDNGYYWSSSAYNGTQAYRVNFFSTYVNCNDNYISRDRGYSVRLVTDVPAK